MKYSRFTIKGDRLDKKAGIINGKEYMLKGRPVITYYNLLAELEDKIEEWIIISIYDSGYNFAISINGIIKCRDEIEEIEDESNLYKSIANYLTEYGFYIDYQDIAEKYSCNLIVCTDGNIEIIERKEGIEQND